MSNRIHYLYRITNSINNKIYIGQSVNPKSRWYQHKNDANRENPDMTIAHAIKKYGSDNFVFEVIAACRNQDDANHTETILIKQYESHVSTGKGYNISFGGLNAPRAPISDETRRKMSKSHLGKRHTEVSKQKMSVVQSNKIITVEARQKMSDAKKGKTHSVEHSRNISKSLKGKPAHNKGKPVSDETRKKISDALKQFFKATVGN